jgi:hypothetical protein
MRRRPTRNVIGRPHHFSALRDQLTQIMIDHKDGLVTLVPSTVEEESESIAPQAIAASIVADRAS